MLAAEETRRDVALGFGAFAAANLAVVGLLAMGVPATSILAAVVGVAAALVVVARPQRGIIILVAVLPYDGLLAIAPLPELVAGWKEGLVVLTVAAAVIAPGTVRAPTRRALPSWVAPVAALALLAVIDVVRRGQFEGLYGLKILLFFTLAAFALWRCPLGRHERDRLVGSLMVNGVVVACWGLVQQAIGPETLNAWGYEYNTAIRFSGSFLRSFSTFEEPFGYAYFLLVVLAVGIPVALADRRRPRNRLFLWLVPIVVMGMAASVVRGGLLGLAVVIAYLGFRAATPRRALLVAFPLALAAILLVPSSVSEAALSSSSTGERTSGWTAILPEVADRPFGAGLGSAGAAAEKVATLSDSTESTYQPDNQYVLLAYELGPIATWLQLLLVITAYGAARTAARATSGSDRALADGVAALTLAAGTVSLISTFFEIFPADALWWILIAIVATLGVPSTSDTDDAPRDDSSALRPTR